MGGARRLRRLLHAYGQTGARGDARLQPAVPRGQPAADIGVGRGGGGVGGAVPSGERLSERTSGSDVAGDDRDAARAGSQPAHAVHSAVQRRRAVRADDRSVARRGVCRQPGHGLCRASAISISARSIQNADGSQSAGARPYPAFGDIQWMENRVLVGLQLAADAPGEAVLRRVDRRWSATRGAGRSPTRPITSRPAAAAPASTPARSASHRTATT